MTAAGYRRLKATLRRDRYEGLTKEKNNKMLVCFELLCAGGASGRVVSTYLLPRVTVTRDPCPFLVHHVSNLYIPSDLLRHFAL